MIPGIEQKPKEEIKAFQEEKLKTLVSYLSTRSPFYKKHFQQHGIDPAKIQTLEDLSNVPPTTKDNLQEFNWEFLCVTRNQVADYTSTSGTLGKPVVVALTEKDIQRLAYNEFISFACADGKKGDTYQLMLTLDRQFMAGIAYYEGIRKLGGGVVRVGPGLPAAQLDTILKIQPTTLVAVPSFLAKLSDFAKQKGITISGTSVKKVVCIGENIRTSDFQLNTLGKKIADDWGVQLYSTYASTEMQTAFTECGEGMGGHSHPELIIIEVLDDLNRPVGKGESGELTITTLDVEGMPLLRYKTGDMICLHEGACGCGRTTTRVSPVLGRKQQMIKIKGTTVYPPGIFEILQEAGIADFVVEVSADDLGTDQLKVFVATGQSTYETLAQAFRARLRVLPEIISMSSVDIEKMQWLDGGRKPVRFVDKRR